MKILLIIFLIFCIFNTKLVSQTNEIQIEKNTQNAANIVGTVILHASLPHINNFLLKPDDELEYKFNTGFWGLMIGIDYFYNPKKYISISLSGNTDFFLPIPAPVDFSGEREQMSSLYLGISNNYKIGKFTYGYGLSFSNNTWEFIYFDDFDPPPPTRDPATRINNAIGMIFPAYYEIWDNCHIGIIYRPTLYRFSKKNPIAYEHLVSLDFAYKLKL